MDLFEQLRREHEFGVGTVAGVAARFGVRRRMVRQAIAGALPPPHHYSQRARPKLDAVTAFIDRVLDADRDAPRKQRHTARRIHRRILEEFPGVAVAESTVRNHAKDAALRKSQDTVRLLGKDVKLAHDADGVVLADAGDGKPAPAAPVAAYIAKAFGGRLEEVRDVMVVLAARIEPQELNRVGFRLYEHFRPEVPQDVKGWGAKGNLDLARIKSAAE